MSTVEYADQLVLLLEQLGTILSGVGHKGVIVVWVDAADSLQSTNNDMYDFELKRYLIFNIILRIRPYLNLKDLNLSY